VVRIVELVEPSGIMEEREQQNELGIAVAGGAYELKTCPCHGLPVPLSMVVRLRAAGGRDDLAGETRVNHRALAGLGCS
jgi:hypothetical protein